MRFPLVSRLSPSPCYPIWKGRHPKRIHIAGPDALYTQPFQVPNTVPAYLQSTHSAYRVIASVTVSQAHFQSIKSAQHLNLDLNPSAPALVQPDPSVSKVPFPIDDKPCRSYYSTKKAPVRDLPQGLLPYLGTTYVLQRSFATRSLRGFREQQRAGLFFFFWSVLASVSVCLSPRNITSQIFCCPPRGSLPRET